MASALPQPSTGQIAQTLLQDTLHNIVHDIVIHTHRDHKLLLSTLDPTSKLPHCDKCNLPCLLDPPLAPKVRGAATDPPKGTEYCDRKPWCRKSGFDIYGNPFPKSDVTGRPPSKREREAAKNRKDGDGTPASDEATANGTAPPSPSADGDGPTTGKESKMEKGEKKAIKIDEKLKKGEYVPWHTCPSCKRSLLITRFAKHLEQCMGLSGRAASRNAMAKMNGTTPAVSRGSTPNPSQEGNRGGNEDEDEDVVVKGPGGVRKKLLKKNAKSSMKKDGKLIPSVTGKLPKSVIAPKRAPGNGATSGARASPAPSSATAPDKRDRDEMADPGDDEDSIPVKKRQKLERIGSTASLASQSTAAPQGAVDLERAESQDGSFVDDGSVAEE